MSKNIPTQLPCVPNYQWPKCDEIDINLRPWDLGTTLHGVLDMLVVRFKVYKECALRK